MFMCTICHEVFNGDTDYTCSTRCGHIYHYKCLMVWIEGKSPSCPQCRSVVDKNKLIKLYLETDREIQPTMNKQTEKEINSLRRQLEAIQNRENNKDNSNSVLKAQLYNLQCNVKESKEENSFLKLELNDCRVKIDELSEQLEAVTVDYEVLKQNKLIVEQFLLIKEKENSILDKNLYELQSGNSVTIEKLNVEVDRLKAKKVYFEYKGKISKDIKDQPSTSKQINIKNYKFSLLRSNQIMNQSYTLHSELPDKNFLWGLTFLIFEDRNWYEDKYDTSKARHNIIKYGGTVVDFYSSNVTHVICVTQRNLLVQQALKDGKICVTNYWLIDVIAKNYIMPPWLAHHFPAPYSEQTGLPCRDLQMKISNFNINEYYRVKTIIQFTGATVVDQLSSTTNVVIAKNLTGATVKMAQALDIPVINVQWLNDIVSGSLSGFCTPMKDIYFQFDLYDPFKVNYQMLSNLMEAWKYPAAINCSYEHRYDPTENNSIEPSKRKRLKSTEHSQVINLVNGDNK